MPQTLTHATKIVKMLQDAGFIAYLAGGYVRDLKSSRPYAYKIEEAKVWKSGEAAQRFLDRKDKTWASWCEIIRVGEQQWKGLMPFKK